MAELAHIMTDLETTGTVPGCAGLSIGAVRFYPETGKLGDEFYTVIDLESSLSAFLRQEEGTMKWWEGRGEDARRVLHEARSGGAPKLRDALSSFTAWMRGQGGFRSLRLYGNGADFDNPILRVMYDAAGLDFLGSTAGFFGGRCYRTLKSLDELFGPVFATPKMSRQGTYHHALDDAKSQATHLMDVVRSIRAFNNTMDDGK